MMGWSVGVTAFALHSSDQAAFGRLFSLDG